VVVTDGATCDVPDTFEPEATTSTTESAPEYTTTDPADLVEVLSVQVHVVGSEADDTFVYTSVCTPVAVELAAKVHPAGGVTVAVPATPIAASSR
jgi:hypothetical protein